MKNYETENLISSIYVSVQCEEPERFLQILSSSGCKILNIHMQGKELSFSFSRSYDSAFLYTIKKLNATYQIHEKKGLYFFIKKYRKAYGLFAGMVLFLALILFITSFVWDIRFEGQKTHSEAELMHFLKKQNVGIGILIRNVNCDKLENSIRKEYFDIAWASVEIRGTRLIVHIKEGENLTSDKVPKEELKTSDLVANNNGIIKKLVVRSGTPIVKIGDKVKKGQILISGEVPVYNDSGEVAEVDRKKANGDVLIEVHKTLEGSIPIRYQKKIETGNKKHEYYVSTWKENILFRFGENKFKNSNIQKSQNQLRILRNLYLPIKCGIVTYSEFQYKNADYTVDELNALVRNKMDSYEQTLPALSMKVSSRNIHCKRTKTQYHYRISYVLSDMSAQQRPVQKIDWQRKGE